MRLVMTVMVRDEIDVLATMLDVHLALGVDHVVAVDNGSSDGSAELLGEYARRGAVTLLPSDPEHFDQASAVTRMARFAARELGADWVVNADADELWWPVAGTLPDVVEAVPGHYGVLVAPRNDFLPPVDARGGQSPVWASVRLRETASVSPQGTRLAPKVAHRGHSEVVVGFGNHSASAPGLAWAPPLPVLEILHLPIRSYEQLERKLRARVPRRSGEGLAPDVGADALMLYGLLERGELREWYTARIAPDRVRDGLRDGALVEDDRVARFIAEGFGPRAREPAVMVAGRDGWGAIDSWIATHVAARVEPLERERGQLLGERDGLAGRIGELEALRDHLDGRLAAERAAHYETAEVLRLLRESRMVRAGAMARRLTRRGG